MKHASVCAQPIVSTKAVFPGVPNAANQFPFSPYDPKSHLGAENNCSSKHIPSLMKTWNVMANVAHSLVETAGLDQSLSPRTQDSRLPESSLGGGSMRII